MIARFMLFYKPGVTEYYPVGMKTHIEYPDIFFLKYNSPYDIEMGTYVLIDSL